MIITIAAFGIQDHDIGISLVDSTTLLAFKLGSQLSRGRTPAPRGDPTSAW